MSSNVHESLLSECLHNMYCLLPFFHLTMCEHFSGIKYVSTSLKWLHDILLCVDHYLNNCWTVNFSTKLSLLLIGNENYNYCCIFVHILFFLVPPCSMWDLSFWSRDQTLPLHWKCSLNHWTAREVPQITILNNPVCLHVSCLPPSITL